MPQQFQGALGFLVGGRDFLLDLGGSFLQLGRELDVAVVLHAGSRRDQPAHNHVFLQAAEMIHGSLYGCLGEHPGRLLEGGGGDEGFGGKRGLGDAQQQRPAGSRLATLHDGALVLFAEAELVHLLLQQELGVAHVFHFDPAHHLAHDDLDVLVADVDALQPVDLLDFVHQVSLQLFFAQHSENVVRVERTIHQRLAGPHALAFLHVDVDAARHRVLLLRAVVGHHVDLALALADFAEADQAINFADDRGFARLAGLEQFHHAGQTAGDVLGFGGFARDLGQHVAGEHAVAVLHHEVRTGGHEVALAALALDHDGRLAFLIRRIGDHQARQAGDLVHFFVQRQAFLQVLELHRAADFGEDGEGVRIPLHHHLAELDRVAFLHLQLGTVDHGVALFLAGFVVHDGDKTVAVHHHQVADLGLHRLQVDEAHHAGVLGFEARLLGDAGSRAADVEGTHGELRSRLADGLRGDDAGSLAQFHQASGSQVAPVAGDANAALGFAGEHGADLHPLDARRLNGSRQLFRDLLVDVYDGVALVVLDLLQGDAAHDAVAQRFDDVARFHDRGHVNAVHGAAIVFADDNVLRHVHQAAGQVAGIGGLKRRIGQSLAGAVGGDEVLQHRQPFAEVGGNRGLDDFAGRLGHQAAHAGELANLLLGTAGAGIGHDVNRVNDPGLVLLLHFAEHFVGYALGNGRPDFDHLVIALAVSDGAVQVLLLHGYHLLLGVAHHALLILGDDHVVNADGQAGAGGVAEAQLLDLIEHPDRHLQAKTQIAVGDQAAHSLLLQQAVDVRHALGQGVIQDGPAHGGVDELPLVMLRLRVRDVLVVVGAGEINHFAGVAQADGSKRFHFAHFQRQQHLINVGEGAALPLGARFALGQIVDSQHHVLRGHGDGLAGSRRQDVVRREHQNAGFNLGLRRKRDVHRHLVAVEIGVKCRAHQRVDLDGLAFHQHRLKRLNTQAVQGGSAVEQHGVVLNHLFQDVPHDEILLLHHLLGLLDGGAVPGLLQAVVDKGLEQLQRHLLGQAALVQLELRPDYDDGAAGVVHALAQQVLAEAALLALERVGKRLERTVVGAAQHAAAAAVVEQRVHRLLQHALFVAHDDFGGVQVHQLLQPVIAVDHAAIQVVEVGGGEAPAIQGYQGAEFRRNDRNHVQNHPLRLVAAFAEGLDYFQALGILQALLHRGLVLHLLAQFGGQLLHLHALEQFLDGLGAHHGLEAGGAELLVQFAELGFVLDDLGFFHPGIAGIHHHVGLEVEHGLEVAQGDIQQVPDAAGQALKEPHVRAGRSQLNVAQALAAHLGERDFHAALVADDAAVLHALVLAAQALPVRHRTENAGTEQAVALRLESAVIDGFRLGDFAVRPAADLFRGRNADLNGVEIRHRVRQVKWA